MAYPSSCWYFLAEQCRRSRENKTKSDFDIFGDSDERVVARGLYGRKMSHLLDGEQWTMRDFAQFVTAFSLT